MSHARRERRELARQEKKQKVAPAQKPSGWYWLWPCLAAFMVYIPSLSFGFIRDDRTELAQIGDLWAQVSQPIHGFPKYYRPVWAALLFFAHRVAGTNPAIWHFLSVCAHVTATYAVFKLCAHFLGDLRWASFAATLFAIHPVHIDAVCWVLCYDNAVLTVFLIAAVLLFLAPDRSRWQLWASIGAWIVALFTKEIAIAMTPIFFVLGSRHLGDWRAGFKSSLSSGMPYLLSAIGYLGVRALVVPVGIIGEKMPGRPWPTVFSSAPSIALSYLRKLAFPVGLSALYDPHLSEHPNFRTWLCLGMLLAIVALLLFVARIHQAVIVSASLIVLPLAPALYVLRFSPNEEMIQDRYMYLPSVGFCLLAALCARWIWSRFPASRNALMSAEAVLVVGFAVLCFAQEGFDANPKALFERAVEVAPHSANNHEELGNAYLVEGKTDLALAQFEEGCRLRSNDNCRMYLGQGLYFAKRYQEAQPLLEFAVGRMVSRRDAVELLAALEQLQDTYVHLGNKSGARRATLEIADVQSAISRNRQESALEAALRAVSH